MNTSIFILMYTTKELFYYLSHSACKSSYSCKWFDLFCLYLLHSLKTFVQHWVVWHRVNQIANFFLPIQNVFSLPSTSTFSLMGYYHGIHILTIKTILKTLVQRVPTQFKCYNTGEENTIFCNSVEFAQWKLRCMACVLLSPAISGV